MTAVFCQADDRNAPTRQFRVLVVEDEALVAIDISSMIRDLGGEVVGIARTGDEALAMAARCPDLVLMDVHLIGRMDGIEAARTIRVRHRLPVVFVTAHSDSHTMQRMFSVVPHAPVAKPILPERLRTAILMALDDR